MVVLNSYEARNNLCALIRLAEAGEQIYIARRGLPIVQLVPCSDVPAQFQPQEASSNDCQIS